MLKLVLKWLPTSASFFPFVLHVFSPLLLLPELAVCNGELWECKAHLELGVRSQEKKNITYIIISSRVRPQVLCFLWWPPLEHFWNPQMPLKRPVSGDGSSLDSCLFVLHFLIDCSSSASWMSWQLLMSCWTITQQYPGLFTFKLYCKLYCSSQITAQESSYPWG